MLLINDGKLFLNITNKISYFNEQITSDFIYKKRKVVY